MESLAGKIALVTGAGKGIGRALVLALAREGVNVGLVSRTASDLEEVAKEAQASGVRAVVASADVSDLASVEAAVSNIHKELGSIDILINNAGIATFGKFLELEPQAWEQQVKVNLFGVYYMIRAVLPGMIERQTGLLITHKK